MANLNLSEFTEKLFVADADHTFIWDSAVSISKRVSRNSWLNSGTLTSDAPVTISQTWNNAAVGFNALVVNAAGTSGTNSASGSLLLNLQVNGASSFFVRKDGAVYGAGNAVFASSVGVGSFGSNLSFYAGLIGGGRAAVSIGNGWSYAFSSGAQAVSNQDVFLTRDDVGTLALRNGANTQTFNVYGSYGSISDYKRLSISCDQTTGNATITNQAAGYTAGTVSINGVPVGRGKGSNTARNISIGDNSLGLNSTGGDNTAVGFYALGANGTGNYNTSFGSQSLFSSNSNHNVALGYLAGTFKAGGATNNPGNENIYIGSQTKALDTAQTNQIVIGYDATGIGSNSVVLGNDSITKTALKGNVGIGTTAPGAKLEVELTGTSTAFKVRNTSAVTLLDAQAVVDIGFSDSRRLIFSAAGDTITVPLFSNLNYINSIGKPLAFIQNNVNALTISSGNVGIGTTSPSSKLHVAGSSSPSITVDNTLATGASQLLFKNTVVTGDTDGIFLNGSTQTGFGGAGSLNIKATTGPLAFHTASVTNAFSMAQTGAATFSQGVTFNNDIYGQRDVYSGNGRYFRFANATALSSSAVGLMLLSDLTGVNLSPRIAFGGVDATFPALKRSGTSASFDVVLANDSGFTSIQDLYRRFGAGTPEGVVTAPIGAVYHNTTGGAGTSFYVKESGTGNTGWVGK